MVAPVDGFGRTRERARGFSSPGAVEQGQRICRQLDRELGVVGLSKGVVRRSASCGLGLWCGTRAGSRVIGGAVVVVGTRCATSASQRVANASAESTDACQGRLRIDPWRRLRIDPWRRLRIDPWRRLRIDPPAGWVCRLPSLTRRRTNDRLRRECFGRQNRAEPVLDGGFARIGLDRISGRCRCGVG